MKMKAEVKMEVGVEVEVEVLQKTQGHLMKNVPEEVVAAEGEEGEGKGRKKQLVPQKIVLLPPEKKHPCLNLTLW